MIARNSLILCTHLIIFLLQAIETARNANGKILVHCKAGVSRSVTVTVAYIMTTYKWSLKQTWMHVRKARSVIHPNRGFLHQLVQYEKLLFPSARSPTLSLHSDVFFTVFERMEELHGAPLMDYCRANPQVQHEVETAFIGVCWSDDVTKN